MYAFSTTTYTGFQCTVSEETSEKFKGLPGVLWVLPDSYIDVKNKDYGAKPDAPKAGMRKKSLIIQISATLSSQLCI
ncbi:hypothetical protein KSP40_PGU017731 [Platanthera guangdongensis]